MINTSPETNLLDAALTNFQYEMPPVKKDVNVKMTGKSKAGNDFSVDYDYSPLESIQAVAKPHLFKNKLNVSQDLGFVFSPQGQAIPVVHTRVAHESGQFKVSAWPLDMSGVTKEQDRGSKITYNKRYAYVAALNIILENEDNDATDVGIDPGNYIVESGPLKGKKISEVSDKVLNDTIQYWENRAAKSNQPLTGPILKLVEMSKAYLEGKNENI